MKPMQRLDGYSHMLLVGTMRTGKSALLTQLMLSALETPPVVPATQLPRPLARPAPEQDVKAWSFIFRKDPL